MKAQKNPMGMFSGMTTTQKAILFSVGGAMVYIGSAFFSHCGVGCGPCRLPPCPCPMPPACPCPPPPPPCPCPCPSEVVDSTQARCERRVVRQPCWESPCVNIKNFQRKSGRYIYNSLLAKCC